MSGAAKLVAGDHGAKVSSPVCLFVNNFVAAASVYLNECHRCSLLSSMLALSICPGTQTGWLYARMRLRLSSLQRSTAMKSQLGYTCVLYIRTHLAGSPSRSAR